MVHVSRAGLGGARPRPSLDFQSARDGRVRTGTFQIRREDFTDEHGQTFARYVFAVRHWVPLAPAGGSSIRTPIRYALSKAASETVNVTRFTLVCMRRLLQGRLSLDSLSGPITIYEVAGEEGRKGTDYFVWVMALLSINLGLLNLLADSRAGRRAPDVFGDRGRAAQASAAARARGRAHRRHGDCDFIDGDGVQERRREALGRARGSSARVDGLGVSESPVEPGPVGPSARSVAARVVQRVLEEGAFVSDALDGELDSAMLDGRDRALATELCYGVIRIEPALGERLESLAKRGLSKGDALLARTCWSQPISCSCSIASRPSRPSTRRSRRCDAFAVRGSPVLPTRSSGACRRAASGFR